MLKFWLLESRSHGYFLVDLPMIGQVYCIHSHFRRFYTIFHRLNTFQTNWQICMFSQPGYIVPFQFRIDETSHGPPDPTAS